MLALRLRTRPARPGGEVEKGQDFQAQLGFWDLGLALVVQKHAKKTRNHDISLVSSSSIMKKPNHVPHHYLQIFPKVIWEDLKKKHHVFS